MTFSSSERREPAESFMNCLIRIRQRYPNLAQSDRRLAEFILTHPDRARHKLSTAGGSVGRQPVKRSEIRPETGI